MTKRMSAKNIRLAVIDMLFTVGKFEPAKYGAEYRSELEGAAWKLCDEQLARWFINDDGTVTFTPE